MTAAHASNLAPAAAGLLTRYRQPLLELAWASVTHACRHRAPVPVETADFAPELRAFGATFVTLMQDGRLRGCIGTITAYRSLIEDVAHNAYGAGFDDPRFPPLDTADLDDIEIHLSLLSPLAPMAAADRPALLAALRPDRDGLVLRSGDKRSVFLPTVWGMFPEPETFVGRLLNKAGLGEDDWPADLRFWRFTTEDTKPGD